MGAVSKKVGWEVTKQSFYPVIILILFIVSYARYKLYIAPLISLQLQVNLRKYIGTVLILCIGFIIHRITTAVLFWYRENVASKTVTQLDDKLIPIFSRSAKVIVWVIVFLTILPLYGVNISALIAALGVGSLAIALAAQDTIANIIAGFLIMVDSPFRVGDRIKLPSGENVQVLDIGVRRSKFLSEDKAIIIVPNLDLSKSKIINYTFGEERLREQ